MSEPLGNICILWCRLLLPCNAIVCWPVAVQGEKRGPVRVVWDDGQPKRGSWCCRSIILSNKHLKERYTQPLPHSQKIALPGFSQYTDRGKDDDDPTKPAEYESVTMHAVTLCWIWDFAPLWTRMPRIVGAALAPSPLHGGSTSPSLLVTPCLVSTRLGRDASPIGHIAALQGMKHLP